MRAKPGDASRLVVKFVGKKYNQGCSITELSRTKPPEEVRNAACACAGEGC